MKGSSKKPFYPKEVVEYIIEHQNEDPYALALKPSPFPEISMVEIAQQIQGRKVAKKKFPFLLEYRHYFYPVKESLEQASSEILANYKSQFIQGSSMVDLTGGMGIDTFILGQRFQQVTYVEPNAQLFDLTVANLNTLHFTRCNALQMTCEQFLESNQEQFDWAYIDPSRRIKGSRKISITNYEPNIVGLQEELFSIAENIMIKLSPMQDISECISVLKNVVQVWVISVQNEVKELLIHLSRTDKVATPTITAVDLKNGKEHSFNALFAERNTEIAFNSFKKYIYQPAASLVKSGLQNCYAKQMELTKLHPNTHLFTSDQRVAHFFGRTFKVLHSVKLNRKDVQRLLPEMKANVISKNFPLKPEVIAQKLKLKLGGDKYLIAYTGYDNKKEVTLCTRQDLS